MNNVDSRADNIRMGNLPVQPVGQAGHVPTGFDAQAIAVADESGQQSEPPPCPGRSRRVRPWRRRYTPMGNRSRSSRRHTPKAAKPCRENGLPRIAQAGRPPGLPTWARGTGPRSAGVGFGRDGPAVRSLIERFHHLLGFGRGKALLQRGLILFGQGFGHGQRVCLRVEGHALP